MVTKMLQAFKQTNKQCKWPDCEKIAVKSKLNIIGKTMFCLHHQLIMLSGRVGPNWERDIYREHLKPICEMSKKTWGQVREEVKAGFDVLGITPSRVELTRRTCQQFDVDHKDGDHTNNNPNNLQTLTKSMHKLKTDVMGDANPTRYKKSKKS